MPCRDVSDAMVNMTMSKWGVHERESDGCHRMEMHMGIDFEHKMEKMAMVKNYYSSIGVSLFLSVTL